ncbi:MAG: C-OmpA-like family protein CmpA [Legionellaceae bacterium]|nr:C-OmpA-like family protein CmpA [Legionellaceae bacterium]
MPQQPRTMLPLIGLLSSLALSGCYHPPYNHFKPHNRVLKPAAKGLGVGAVAGALAGNTLAGAAIGGAAGTAVGIYRSTRSNIIQQLANQSIQYEQYGDMRTLIVPTDKYFLLHTPRLNELMYPGLENIIRLLAMYPDSTIYVAGFTDNIGSRLHQQKITQAQAEAMLTYLWANGIHAKYLHAEGYGEKHPIGDNALIHGSAFNRRLEIQWRKAEPPKLVKAHYLGWKK